MQNKGLCFCGILKVIPICIWKTNKSICRLYFSVFKYRIYPITPIIPDSFCILLFPKLFQHNVRMPKDLQ